MHGWFRSFLTKSTKSTVDTVLLSITNKPVVHLEMADTRQSRRRKLWHTYHRCPAIETQDSNVQILTREIICRGHRTHVRSTEKLLRTRVKSTEYRLLLSKIINMQEQTRGFLKPLATRITSQRSIADSGPLNQQRKRPQSDKFP